MKRFTIMAILLVSMMMMLPMANAQIGLTSINENILTQDTYSFEIATSVAGDVLYLNLTINDGLEISVQVYRGISKLPVDEVFIGGGTGTFEENITLVGGLHTVYLYNPSLESVIFVHGVWGINYEPEPTTTVPTDFTNITDTTGPTKPVDYIGIFMSVMFTWVFPSLIVLVAVFLVWNYFRVENYDYLTIFGEDELLGNREDNDREEEYD